MSDNSAPTTEIDSLATIHTAAHEGHFSMTFTMFGVVAVTRRSVP